MQIDRPWRPDRLGPAKPATTTLQVFITLHLVSTKHDVNRAPPWRPSDALDFRIWAI